MFNSPVNNLLFNLIKDKPIYLLASLCLSLGSTILNLVSTTLLIPISLILLGNVEQISGANHPIAIDYFFDFLFRYQTKYQLGIMTFMVCSMILLKNLLNYISTVIGLQHTKDLVYSLKTRGLKLLCRVEMDYYQKNTIGSIVLKLNREIERTALAVKSIQNILIISITILLLTALLVYISWQLSLISLVSLTLIIYLNSWLLDRQNRIKILTSEKIQASNLQVIEFLSGIRLIKAVANELAASRAIAKSIREKDRQQLITQSISAAIKPITEISGTIVVLILGISSYYLYPLAISEVAAILLIYLVVLFRLLPFISQFNNAKLQFINARSSVEAVANFLQVADRRVPNLERIIFSKLHTGIEFEAVTFAYPNHAQIVLDKISFSILQGQTTALVGFFGGGKSIIADLLTGFYEPIEGKILLDGNELKNYDSATLRQAIAVVSRNTFLFSNSLAYNIAYGMTHANPVDIVAAAKKAGIYQFINQLPAGFATKVGEGITLTEPQKLQISIARAFLRDPQILILDEPIDYDRSATSKSIQESLATLCRDRTTLIITKQLNLARQAERIIVFSHSKVVETGTHSTLLQQGGAYQRLYSMQFKSNQQSRQLKLAQKIAQKLAQQTDSSLSLEISSSINALLDRLELINESLFSDDREQDKILDESYQSAKNMLVSLREYEQKLLRESDRENF